MHILGILLFYVLTFIGLFSTLFFFFSCKSLFGKILVELALSVTHLVSYSVVYIFLSITRLDYLINFGYSFSNSF